MIPSKKTTLLLMLCLAIGHSDQLRSRLVKRSQLEAATTVYVAPLGSETIADLPSLVEQLNNTNLTPHHVELLLLKVDNIVQSLLKTRDVSEEACTDGSFPSISKPIDYQILYSLQLFLGKFHLDQLYLCADVFLKTLRETRAKSDLKPESDLVKFSELMAARGFKKLSTSTMSDFRQGLVEFAASKFGLNSTMLSTIADTAKLKQMMEPLVTSCNDIKEALYPVDEIYYHIDWSTIYITNLDDLKWLSYVELCRGLNRAHVAKTIGLVQQDKLSEPIKWTKIAPPASTRQYSWQGSVYDATSSTTNYNYPEARVYADRLSSQSPYQLLADHL